MRPLSFIRVAVCLALGCLAAHAQDQVISVQLRTFPLTGMPKGLCYKSGDKYVTLPAKAMLLSDPINYNGPATMALFDGTKKPVGKVMFTKGGSYTVALVDQGDGTIAGAPMTSAGFTPGAFRFLNIAPIAVTVDLGGKKFTIKAGETQFVTPTIGNLEIHYYVAQGEKLVEVNNTVIASDGKARRTEFIILNNAAQLAANPAAVPVVSAEELYEPAPPAR